MERLGVSRTPLRLALATLQHEGLLENLKGGGYAVREFTMDEIRDAIELRESRGNRALRGGTRGDRGPARSDASACAEMDPLVHRSDDSFWQYVECNRAFHARP